MRTIAETVLVFIVFGQVAVTVGMLVWFTAPARRRMTRRAVEWLGFKWAPLDASLREDYRVTFNSIQGRRVLHHLMDTAYCLVYEGSDPIAMATLNGRRTLVHEILEVLDQAENPGKYSVTTEQADAFAR